MSRRAMHSGAWMTLTGIGILVVIAAVITVPSVLLIPHARQSPAFSRILWGSTFVIAFLGGWLGLGYADSAWATAVNLNIGDTPVFPLIVGEVGAAVVLNLLLFLLDRFDQPVTEEGGEEEIILPEEEKQVP